MRLSLFATNFHAMLASWAGPLNFSASSLAIHSPSTLLSCNIATYSWTSTAGPYTLQVIEHPSAAGSASTVFSSSGGSQATFSAPPSDDGEGQRLHLVIVSSGQSAKWLVDARPGQRISVVVVDANGARAETGLQTVVEGGMSCLAQTDYSDPTR